MTQRGSSRELNSAFFYGTLMAPAVLARVTGRHVSEITSATNGPSQSKAEHQLGGSGFIPSPSPLVVRPAILHEHTRRRVKEADYPAVIADEGHGSSEESSVRGTWVDNLTKSDLWRLDMFEGDEYERRPVTVELLSGEVDQSTGVRTLGKEDLLNPSSATTGEDTHGSSAQAETYIWIAGEDRLEEREWDFDEFVREKMWRWAAGDREDIRAVDDAVAAMNSTGDGTGGRAIGGSFDKLLAE